MSWCDLPEVALIRVLNYLPVLDQIKSARLICRYWKQIIDSSVLQDELILFLEIHPRPVYWYHDGMEADLSNAILVNQRSFLENELSLKYFRRLRRLMVVSRMGVDFKRLFKLVEASCQQLEHLQFSYLGHKCYIHPDKYMVYETNLKLANLRTFYSQAGDLPPGLHFPQLSELYVYSHLNIKAADVKTRLCIQNLRTLLVRELSYPPGFEFSNLEVFYFNEPSSTISLNDFPRLKEIHYFKLIWDIRRRIKDALGDLLEQKRILKRRELRVYSDGFELNDRTDLNLFENFQTLAYRGLSRSTCELILNENALQLIKENPSRLKFNLLSKWLVMSDCLDDQLIGLQGNDEFKESMFRSAQYIHFGSSLLTRKTKNLNLFKMCDRFQYVCSVNVAFELSQPLLDQLPDALPHLVEFTYDRTSFFHRIVDFQFIGRFKSLHTFRVHPHLLSVDELRFIFENCKFINRVEFEKSNASIELCRSFGSQVYQAEWYSSNDVLFAWAIFSVNELLDYFEASKWVEKNDFLGTRQQTTFLQLRSEIDDFLGL